jgi:hypothetical protein
MCPLLVELAAPESDNGAIAEFAARIPSMRNATAHV